MTALLPGDGQPDNVFAALLQQYPIWIGVVGALLLLLVVGLVLLLVLMTRSKRMRSAQVKRYVGVRKCKNTRT